MLHHNRMPYRRPALMLLAVIMLIGLLAACGQEDRMPGEGKGNVIATYKDGELTDAEFDKYAALMAIISPENAMYMSFPQFKPQFIEQYIVTKVLLDQVSKENRDAAKEQTANFKKSLEDGIKNQPELKEHMDTSDLSVNEAMKFVEGQIIFQNYMTSKTAEFKPAVTEEEIKKQYDDTAADFNMVSVRHILIGTIDPQTNAELNTDEEALKIAKEVQAKLKDGGDWNSLAKEYSTDEGSKENGGLYENQQAKGWVAEFKEAANTQEINAVGEPVRSQFGYHVMKVESRVETPYESIADTDKENLRASVANIKLSEFLASEQDKLEIVVTLPEEPVPTASESPSASPSESPSASPSASAN